MPLELLFDCSARTKQIFDINSLILSFRVSQLQLSLLAQPARVPNRNINGKLFGAKLEENKSVWFYGLTAF